jgi:serine phosphatase RsbU (regulator of sigma subunit)
MSLRVRLIVAFFLLSVVPLGAVTFYTYTSNAAAMRDAAGREAELLADDLTERMKLVTAQLSQQFERLMDIPSSTALTPTAVSEAARNSTTAARGNTPAPGALRTDVASPTASANDATRVAWQLGEVAMLLNNIEVRGFGLGRRGRGAFDAPPPPPMLSSTSGPPPEVPHDRGGPGPPPDARDGRPFRGDGPRGGGGDFDRGRGFGGPPPYEPPDPNRIQIDLAPMRRDILQQLFPDRERWDELSPQERELILTKVNERMLGIRQGIQILQQKATEQADRLRAEGATGSDAVVSAAGPASAPASSPASDGRAPSSLAPAPAASAGSQAPTSTRSKESPPRAARTRQTALSGSRMDVRVMQGGEIVGQVNAEINLPNLLATVFTTTRRDQGEVPFAVDKSGRIYTPTDTDRSRITSLNTAAARPETAPGTDLVSDWVIVTTADPTGSGLKFGIARPLGGALDELRRSSARNAGLGLGLIGLALIGIAPLSSRLTRNLSRLSDGVNQIAKGDYHARVDVTSKDEIGELAGAFNRMAADVERHQRAAVEQERLRRELELGRKIQHDMLPQTPLRLGLTEVRGVSVAAREVGGDFFNYFLTPRGAIALVMGDVSGKGVGAALLMANIQASLRTRLALGQDLASLARELDADIGASTPGAVYSTLFVALLDPSTRTLDYVNAGHNPQLVLRSSGGLERMESTGLPIGLLAGHGYSERRVSLAPDDVLFFYTDGCVEAENAAGDMFGAPRLEALLTSHPAASTDDTLSRVEQAIVEFRAGREPFDDATMMVVHVG